MPDATVNVTDTELALSHSKTDGPSLASTDTGNSPGPMPEECDPAKLSRTPPPDLSAINGPENKKLP